MYLFKKLEQLNKIGVDNSFDLTELLANGKLPNGQVIDETTRKSYINATASLLYETANELRHIINVLNN